MAGIGKLRKMELFGEALVIWGSEKARIDTV